MLIEIIPWQEMKPGVRVNCSSPLYEDEWYEVIEVGTKWHEDSHGEVYRDISCIWHDGIHFKTRQYKRDTRSRVYE